MRPTLLLALLVVGLGCSVRAVEQDEPPDVEGLCRAYCERLIDCVVYDLDIPVRFDDLEECTAGCAADERWEDPACEGPMEDLFVCYASYDCPEFRTVWTEPEDPPCQAENSARSGCIP